MTPSHVAFAAVSTVYLVIAMFYEERTLHETFGPAYADYARKVRRKMVPGVY
jgi:protein-S-isoprenylcysteine O-methyltransferase Ste14